MDARAILFVFLASSAALASAEPPVMTVTDRDDRVLGVPVEEHVVTTEDGYNLLVHRIPHGKENGDDPAADRMPVFLGHCLTCTSAVFSFGPPQNDIAYLLADAGYDVWLGNTRGNTWSRSHESLDPDDPAFWDFEWDQTATRDYPAEIDYVLDATGRDDLFFVGYSMGGTQYFAMLAELPEYNSKIRAGFTNAPGVYMGNAFNPIFALADLAEDLQEAIHDLGIYEFLPHYDAIEGFLAHEVCDDEHPDTQELCADILGLAMPRELVNASMISFYLDHMPGGSTTEMFVHYTQLFQNPDMFRKYDFGAEGNLEAYGQDTPPEYDLSLVTAPTAIFVGDGDGLVSVADSDLLASQLPNLIHYEVVDYPGWTHASFILANNAGELVYSNIVDMMNELK